MICSFSAVTEAGKVGGPLAVDFFREEYILNNAIGRLYTLYYICIITHLLSMAHYSHKVSLYTFTKPQKNTLFDLFRIMQETLHRSYWRNNDGRGEYYLNFGSFLCTLFPLCEACFSNMPLGVSRELSATVSCCRWHGGLWLDETRRAEHCYCHFFHPLMRPIWLKFKLVPLLNIKPNQTLFRQR